MSLAPLTTSSFVFLAIMIHLTLPIKAPKSKRLHFDQFLLNIFLSALYLPLRAAAMRMHASLLSFNGITPAAHSQPGSIMSTSIISHIYIY